MLPESNNKTASENQRSTDIDGYCGRLMKADTGYDLRHHKEEHYIYAEEFSEVPSRDIYG